MWKALLHRLLISIPLLVSVSMVTFVLAALTPGNAARTILGLTATKAQLNALERSLGLDQALYIQYWHWLVGVLHGNLGDSIFTGEPVSRILNVGLPITLTLIVAAVGGSLIVGVPLGIVSAEIRCDPPHRRHILACGFCDPIVLARPSACDCVFHGVALVSGVRLD